MNPACSSQTCSARGFVARANRRTQSEFSCRACGHEIHADVNAARDLESGRTAFDRAAHLTKAKSLELTGFRHFERIKAARNSPTTGSGSGSVSSRLRRLASASGLLDRRKEGPDWLKARKDRARAGMLIGLLSEERPAELADARRTALARGPAWRNRIAASLELMREARQKLDRVRGVP